MIGQFTLCALPTQRRQHLRCDYTPFADDDAHDDAYDDARTCAQLTRDMTVPQPSAVTSLTRMVAGVVAWEGAFQISKFFLRHLPERDDKERTYKRAAASYIVSFIHAFFLTWAGWTIVRELEFGGASASAERLSLYANDDASFVGFVEIVTIAFFSYVVYDLLHVIDQYPDLGGVDILAHHFGFFAAALLAYAYGAYPLMLGWLCTCETSTPVLNVRFFIKSWREMEYTLPNIDAIASMLGMKTRGVIAGNWMEYYVSVAFLWVFVAVRVIGYGYALIRLTGDLKLVDDNFIPYTVRAILYTLTCAGLMLNLVWSYKIYGMCRHFRRKVLKQRDDSGDKMSDSEEDATTTTTKRS
jgi:hypothetical protein